MGNILVFKNADFSANAIETSSLLDQIASFTNGGIAVGYSSLYYVDMPITRDCVVYELVLRRGIDPDRIKYASKLVSGRLGIGEISSSLIEPLDLTKDSNTNQRVKLLTPLELHIGDYVGFNIDKNRIINPNANREEGDVAYTNPGTTPVEFNGNLLVGYEFESGTKVYESTFASYVKLYGLYK